MSLPALESIAEKVKAARTAKGLSQRALSQRTGIPQSHISKIENAGSDIRISSMLMIAHALDLELTLIPRGLVKTLESLKQNAAKQSGYAAENVTAPTPAYALNDEEDDDHG